MHCFAKELRITRYKVRLSKGLTQSKIENNNIFYKVKNFIEIIVVHFEYIGYEANVAAWEIESR